MGARCAIRNCPMRQPRHPTVRVRPLELLTAGPLDSPVDRSCSLSGAPSSACYDSARAGAHCRVHCSLLQSTIGVVAVISHGTPDN